MTHLDSSTRANNIQVCAPPSNTPPRPEHHTPHATWTAARCPPRPAHEDTTASWA